MRSAFFLCATVAILGGILWAGDLPERRYESASCQYHMIHKYTPKDRLGLVTVGGSRVRYATSAADFDEVLTRLRPGALPVHNLAHAYYSLGKEYVLLRDMLQRHQVKAALIMVTPRLERFGAMHPTFLEIARVSDIPLTVRALWPEDPLGAIDAATKIVIEHLKPNDRVGKLRRIFSERNCAAIPDPRLNLPLLIEGAAEYDRALQRELAWDITAPDQEGFRRWMAAFRALSEQSGTQFIFFLVTGTDEPLPSSGFETEFENVTGMKLIAIDPAMHARLSPDGKRDNIHINAAGRADFLPWLIRRIDEKCVRTDGCY